MRVVTTLCLVLSATFLSAAEPKATSKSSEEVAAGHSYHGEAFNEGPRQAAELIPGMAEIQFPTSAKDETAQAFVEQGISQLHGFWYLEAERSFRQAAKIEPDLAIAYWGMALANTNNGERARGLIDEAMERRKGETTKRERLYIEALDRFLPKPKKEDEGEEEKEEDEEAKKKRREAERDAKKSRAERYLADLEKIIHEFPDDIEARALIGLQLWLSERDGVKVGSRYAVSALLGEVFNAQPMHPAHHFRIHLWDHARPENALESAALCGPSSPGIAHMWHMPGHIYSRLKRYDDAAWQQEASARVDHAHMSRARLLPDQIHNYAHNNEWLTRNLLFVGRVEEALDQARNLVSLPRHPKYNSLEKRGSYRYGRMRLLQTFSQYMLWEELIAEAEGASLPMTDIETEQEELLSWLAVAHFKTDQTKLGAEKLRELRRRLLALREQLLDLAENAASESPEDSDASEDSDSDENEADEDEDDDAPSRDEIKRHITRLRQVIARAAAAATSQRKDKKAFQKVVDRARLDRVLKAQWLADAGDLDGAIKEASEAVKDGKSQVLPKAMLTHLLWEKGEKDKAKKEFKELQTLAGAADMETPVLARLQPVADSLEIEGDWRTPAEPADDLGDRPVLDTLGPFRWQSYDAEPFVIHNVDGEKIADTEFEGKPRLVIFYLGFGCLHCVEQLHEFSPMLEEYQKAGIDVLAVSTESVKQLGQAIDNFEKEMNIPLYSDEGGETFKKYRCWDDFEDQPLHGTFLIDAKGRVRWQDISYEPFMEPEFLLEESKRLLELDF
ncbi:MAG: peroxiredoxin family protein [Planctomycetota bacterium]